MKDTALIQVKNLTVSYDGIQRPAVQNINFSLKKGTITMLVGPNGSGKSTLLKALLGIIPYKGTITMHTAQNENSHVHLKTDFGYVPQRFDFDLDTPMTVHEFLLMALLTCKHSRKEKEIFIKNVLEKVDASSLEYRKIGDLSGGQRQRIILARALIHNPQLLILDEPEAGIDEGGEKLFYTLLLKLVKEKNMTALIATHELDIVNKYADTIITLKNTHNA